MLSPHITYSHKFNQSGVDLTNLYKLRNAHQDTHEGVMVRSAGKTAYSLMNMSQKVTGFIK